MSPQPDPAAPIRRRRRHSSRRYLYFSAIACAAVLIWIPLAHERSVRQERSRTAVPEETTRSSDLVLSEANVREAEGQTFIGGVLKNQSKKRYRDIQIGFRVRSRTGAVLGSVTAKLDRLEPGASAEFRTTPLPEDAARFGALDIVGTAE